MDTNPAQPLGSQQKESAPLRGTEATLIEVGKEEKPAKEVEGWIERVEKADANLASPVRDDYGQVLVSSAAPQKPKIVLPLDQNQLSYGLTQKITDSIRWLAEWCRRILRLSPERAEFKKG